MCTHELLQCLSEDFNTRVLDMINMIKLGFIPHACCWVHRRGRAQALLAVYVYPLNFNLLSIYLTILKRSEQTTGVIRIYDGRGDDKPLLTIDKVHRAPVHVMTVSFGGSACFYVRQNY